MLLKCFQVENLRPPVKIQQEYPWFCNKGRQMQAPGQGMQAEK